MPDLDLDRCVREGFAHHDTMTPEQRALAESLIHDGPPNTLGYVILTMVPGATWDVSMNTVTARDGTVVKLRHPGAWHGSGPVALTVPT